MALGLTPEQIVEKGEYQLLVKADHWERVHLGEIAQVQNGFAFKSTYFDRDGGMPLIRIRDISKSETEHRYNGEYDSSYVVSPGDILIGMDGDFLASRWRGRPALLNQRVCRVKLTLAEYFDERFLFLCLQPYLDAINAETSSVTVKHLSSRAVEAIPLPLPPLSEQGQVVDKVEELFSEIDKGVESLRTAKGQLTAYRQAVLKHAFEGKLTQEWREQNKEKLPTSKQLLAFVQSERNAEHKHQLAAWTEAVADWESTGRPGRKPTKPKQPRVVAVLPPEELDELPPLPGGYLYTYLENVGDLGRGKSKHRPRNDAKLFGGPYPFIQTGEVKAAKRVISQYSQTYSEFGLAQSKLWPKGTLCITIAANIAETAFLGFNGCFPDSVVGFTPTENIVLPEYVELFIKAVRVRIEAYAPATAQKNINLTTLENLVIPLCSIDEQKRLVDQVGAILSAIDTNEAEIDANIARVDVLRRTILQKAFSGELVAQDPTDEPAAVVLDRIRAEKERPGKARTNSKRRNSRKDAA